MDVSLTKEDQEDLVSTLILISLNYEDLLKLDGPLFPIDFEVWDETRRVHGILEYRISGDLITHDIGSQIKDFLSTLLEWPSENWNRTHFETSEFWADARGEARRLVKLLGVDRRGYWN